MKRFNKNISQNNHDIFNQNETELTRNVGDKISTSYQTKYQADVIHTWFDSKCAIV